jgi:cation transport protein ChaC
MTNNSQRERLRGGFETSCIEHPVLWAARSHRNVCPNCGLAQIVARLKDRCYGSGMTAKTLSEQDLPHGDLWVFGYGSLMWRPGFDFLEKRPAKLIGEHRALCIYSFHHRGTPEKPGLVLGLDRGGACNGTVFRVAEKHRMTTIAYLREREQVTTVYREVIRSVWLDTDARERVGALAYVTDRSHVQYAGRLSLDAQLHLIRQGHGHSGPNSEYVVSTVEALEREGYRDAKLHRLVVALRQAVPVHRRAAP